MTRRRGPSTRGDRLVETGSTSRVGDPSPGAAFARRGASVGKPADELEARRQERQREIDASRTTAERNRRGQFATPFRLASAMTARALGHLPADAPISLIEPACGSGVFFSALHSRMDGRRVLRRCGVEVDARFAAAARGIWKPEGVEIHATDFFDFAADRRRAGRFNLLCANPPYVRHHHLSSDRKRDLRRRVVEELGLRTSGLTGLYVYFVLLADALLEPGAVAAWLIPAEFLVVQYGAPLREYLRTRVTLLEIFRFDTEGTQFDDALVSSCVVIYRKAPAASDHAVLFRQGTDLDDARHERRVAIGDLPVRSRWLMAGATRGGSAGAPATTVGDLFTVRRGIATGANDFFVLTRECCMAHGLPARILRPILASPRQIEGNIIECDAKGVPRIPEPRFLLDCRLSPAELARRHPKAWAYLEQGHRQGVAGGYLCRHREPWYAQERRPPARFLVSYLGRSTRHRDAPFRFFLNRSQATATNGFLCLYPKPDLARMLADHPEREVELLRLLDGIDAATLRRNGRAYGGGLHKVEPSELLGLPLPGIPAWLVGDPDGPGRGLG